MVSIAYTPPSPWTQIGQGLGSIGAGYMKQENWQAEMNQQKRRLDMTQQGNEQQQTQNDVKRAGELAKLLEEGSQQPPGSPGRGFTGLKLKMMYGYTPGQVDDFVNDRSGKYPLTFSTEQSFKMLGSDITAVQQKGAVDLGFKGVSLDTKSSIEAPNKYKERVHREGKDKIADIDRQIVSMERAAPETTTYEIGEKGTAAEGLQTGSITQKTFDEGAMKNLKELRDFWKRISGASAAMAQTKGYENFWDEIKGSGLSPQDIPNWRSLGRANLILNAIKKWMKERPGGEVAETVAGHPEDTSARRRMEQVAKESDVPPWVVGLSKEVRDVVFEFRTKGMSWEKIKTAIR